MTTDRGDDVDTLRPRVVGDTSRLPSIRGGSAWRLEPPTRGLDANVIDLPPGDEIRNHVGPALDVLIHVLAGDGSLETDDGSIPLAVGTIVWLPPHSTRRFLAGPHGLRYFSVHQRKPGLTIASRPR
ncbi:cupin domain-containing protein [Microbacterium sp. NPDC055910]|uniref:cupin domain-containing protein n=1 Tax=Microbacterium sp. NPDC055910 TaxID=3345659 RepID=UPI0035D60AAF